MEVVGEAILSALFQRLFEKLTSSEVPKFAQKKQLETRLLDIQAVLIDAEEKQITTREVKLWLSRLQHLAYDIEDILDEFAIEALQEKSAESQASMSTMQTLITNSFIGLKPSAVVRHVMLKSRLKEISTRLEDIVTEKNRLNLTTVVEGRSNGVNRKVPTTSLVKERKVYGREKDKEAILELLMRSDEASESPFSVIPIVGMGGLGKTTLAQLVYNDEGVKFDYKAWVFVSEDFDVLRITKAILSHWESPKDDELTLLQGKLKEKLFKKKFLIVLDDVWTESYEDWTTLCSPFLAGASGSKIIVTTRSRRVSLLMGSVTDYELKGLSIEDCMSLFTQHALDKENFDAHRDLEEIGQEIVKRCMGLPLAAKTLGGLLRRKCNREEWEDILNSKIWDLPEDSSSILPALRLSYHHLPSHLKPCFAYCAIFPKGYEFEKNELVSLWMAEGLVPQPKEKTMEDMGDEYFRDLLSRSFFQQSNSDVSRYVMHDLISDLAQFVGGEISIHLDDKTENTKSRQRVRYAAFGRRGYDVFKRFETFYEMKNLRTFLALPIFSQRSHYDYLSSKVLYDLVPKLKRLRVLSLSGYNFFELPSSVGSLKHLRHLNLSNTPIERLPESLGNLFNLQTLNLWQCKKVKKLPTSLSNLINLQHLDIDKTDRLQEMPPHVGNLTKLYTLPKFIVGKRNGVGIRELMKLSHLRGLLHIKQLHNVENVRDAELANLKEKQGVNRLVLEWINDFHSTRDEEAELQVFNSLRPHQNLEKLLIKAYGGAIFPSWVGDPSFGSLWCFELFRCYRITSLPSLGQLPVLKELYISRMKGVKRVGLEFFWDGSSSVKDFPSLEILSIYNLPEWEQWSWSDSVSEEGAGKFPKLQEMSIRNCPKFIGKLPTCLSSLKYLHIDHCPQLASLPEMLPSLHELSITERQAEVLRNLNNLTSLGVLRIKRISGLVSFRETFIQALVALENLEIEGCGELTHLWEDGTSLDSLSCLKCLKVVSCERLVSLVEGMKGLLPCNLETLTIEKCASLKKLANGLHSLESLKCLNITDCGKLVSLVEGTQGILPPNLEEEECENVEKLPNGFDSLVSLIHLNIYHCPKFMPSPTASVSCHREYVFVKNCEAPLLEEIIFDNGRTHLQGLSIEECQSLAIGKFLDSLRDRFSNLTELDIINFPSLESFPERGLAWPNLIYLVIAQCENLRSLPNEMQNLTALQSLMLRDCGLVTSLSGGDFPPNLTRMDIVRCKNLRQPMSEWGLHRLSSLKSLTIFGPMPSSDEVVSFPDNDGLLLPFSLTYLRISVFNNLKYISRGIQNLNSLEELHFYDCRKLQSLPKKSLPATLGCLQISSCSLLKQWCLRNWPIIAHIPCITMDGIDVDCRKLRSNVIEKFSNTLKNSITF